MANGVALDSTVAVKAGSQAKTMVRVSKTRPRTSVDQLKEVHMSIKASTVANSHVQRYAHYIMYCNLGWIHF